MTEIKRELYINSNEQSAGDTKSQLKLIVEISVELQIIGIMATLSMPSGIHSP
jgi:hypothetical protein